MFHCAVKYPVNTKRWFYYVGYNIFTTDFYGFLCKFDKIRWNNKLLFIHNNLDLVLLKFFLCHGFERIRDRLCFSFEGRSEFSHIWFYNKTGDHFRFIIFDVHGKFGLAGLCMRIQVIVCPVCDTHDLDPSEPVSLNFRIPAIDGIVCHLILHMLPESQVSGGYADTLKEMVGKCDMVCKEFVGNDPLFKCIANCHLLNTAVYLSFLRI